MLQFAFQEDHVSDSFLLCFNQYILIKPLDRLQCYAEQFVLTNFFYDFFTINFAIYHYLRDRADILAIDINIIIKPEVSTFLIRNISLRGCVSEALVPVFCELFHNEPWRAVLLCFRYYRAGHDVC